MSDNRIHSQIDEAILAPARANSKKLNEIKKEINQLAGQIAQAYTAIKGIVDTIKLADNNLEEVARQKPGLSAQVAAIHQAITHEKQLGRLDAPAQWQSPAQLEKNILAGFRYLYTAAGNLQAMKRRAKATADRIKHHTQPEQFRQQLALLIEAMFGEWGEIGESARRLYAIQKQWLNKGEQR